MARELADRQDLDFVVFEQLDTEGLISAYEKFDGLDRKTLDLAITEARKLALKELLPANEPGDREGIFFDQGEVKVPKSFHRAYELYCQGDWITFMDDEAVGGQGMPATVWAAVTEYFVGANLAFIMYPALCHGIGKVIELFGTTQQKEIYLEKLYTGQWGGAMLLTEPQAGSDVGELTTSAARTDNGTYAITGSKIFITGGEHDLTDNIIHLVLARIEGAPKGTRGISLFLVPKIRVNGDGSLGRPNDVVCTGVEEKMGIHGSATCSLTLGSSGGCRGYLIGEENKGMKAMFSLMNEARLGVAIQAHALAGAAWTRALDYARQRCQGKHLLETFNPEAAPVPIIQHPDVRRMLLWMKSHVEGMRSLIYYTAKTLDLAELETDPAQKETYQGLVEILTPILKCYCSERSFEVCTQALQVFGGYGYTTEYPMEQFLRDCKITSIYEGTSGIQAMDLLGRKMGMQQGKLFMDLLAQMHTVIARAKEIHPIADLAMDMERAVNRASETAMHLGTLAMSPDVMTAFSFAHPFLMALGDVAVGWMLLDRAVTAADKLAAMDGQAKQEKRAAFYNGQIGSARFFIRTELPGVIGRFEAIVQSDSAAMDMPDLSF